MKKNLESQLEGIGKLQVKKSFTCTGSNFEITWVGIGGNKPELIVDASNLRGNQAVASVETTHNGGVIYGPLSGEFLHTAETKPQVRMRYVRVTHEGIQY